MKQEGKIRIAHLGANGANLGDNAATINVRLQLVKHMKPLTVEWVPINILDFHFWENDIYVSKLLFSKVLKDCDVLLIGGGGILEGGLYNNFCSGWKLPFTEDILDTIEMPIYVVAAGVNYFREMAGFTETGKRNLSSLVQRSEIFTVRNDGSIDDIRELVPSDIAKKIYEIPDPGLIYDFECDVTAYAQDKFSVFQPAVNGDLRTMEARYLTDKDMEDVVRFPKEMGLKIFPHTLKDFLFEEWSECKSLFTKQQFEELVNVMNYDQYIAYYSHVKSSIASRGHGQMIALALNIPSLYFSTQDKVLNFSKRHHLMDYTVDIKEEEWYDKLTNMYERLNNDPEYLAEWHNKRDKLIHSCRNQFNDFCIKLATSLKTLIGE